MKPAGDCSLLPNVALGPGWNYPVSETLKRGATRQAPEREREPAHPPRQEDCLILRPHQYRCKKWQLLRPLKPRCLLTRPCRKFSLHCPHLEPAPVAASQV